MIDQQVKEALDALKDQVGKNVELLSRVDQIEKAAQEGTATVKQLREQIEVLQREDSARKEAIETMQRDTRRQAIERENVRDPRRGLAVLGAMCRQMLARHIGQEVPSQFRETEESLIRDYRESLQRDTLQAGATTGSYLVPTVTETELVDAIEEVSDVLSRTDFIPGLPGNVNWPVLTGRPTLQHSRSTVDTAMTASAPTFGELQVRPEELYIYFPVDNRLLLMSAVQLGGLMQNLLRDGIIDGLAKLVVAGGGPAGFASILGAAADYRYTLPSSKTGFGDFTYMDAVKAVASVLKRGRARGVWLGAFDVLHSWGDITRGSGKVPLVQAASDGSMTVLHKPAVVDEDMPDLSEDAADTPFAAFGDLATMLVGLQAGIQIAVSTEHLFSKNQTAFRGVINADIKRKPVKTLTTLRTAAA